MLNFDLLRSPINWLTVATMVLIGLFVVHYGSSVVFGSITTTPTQKPHGRIT